MSRRKIVPIIGLDYKDTRVAGIRWLSRYGDPYQMSLADLDGRVGLELGVYGVPETFFVDAQGIVRYKHIGPITEKVLESVVLPKLNQLTREAAQKENAKSS